MTTGLTNQQTTQAKKDILSPVSGEVVLTNQKDIVWVFMHFADSTQS